MTRRNIDIKKIYKKELGPAAFIPLEQTSIENCVFEKITLETGDAGLLPLQCAEFNEFITNAYVGLEYYWIPIEKPYGTVYIPLLGGSYYSDINYPVSIKLE